MVIVKDSIKQRSGWTSRTWPFWNFVASPVAILVYSLGHSTFNFLQDKFQYLIQSSLKCLEQGDFQAFLGRLFTKLNVQAIFPDIEHQSFPFLAAAPFSCRINSCPWHHLFLVVFINAFPAHTYHTISASVHWSLRDQETAKKYNDREGHCCVAGLHLNET
jgi:hypothetical protein